MALRRPRRADLRGVLRVIVDLLTSTVVGEWKDPARQLCNPEPPDPCDCGFVGEWPYRWVMVWHDEPSHRAGDRMKRRWLAKGWPVLDGGWWVIGGMDERCPGCGDIERFDMEHERIRQFEERARVLTLARASDDNG